MSPFLDRRCRNEPCARASSFSSWRRCASARASPGASNSPSISAPRWELVLLHVAVVDPQGRYIPPLSVEDFRIFDDDLEQEIELFLAPTDAPVDIALVLDSSASMAPVERTTRRAALAFMRRLDIDDCIFALPFRDVVGPGQWGRSADPQLHGFINRIRPGGGTSLYDALLEGALGARAAARTGPGRAGERGPGGTRRGRGPRRRNR